MIVNGMRALNGVSDQGLVKIDKKTYYEADSSKQRACRSNQFHKGKGFARGKKPTEYNTHYWIHWEKNRQGEALA